MIARVQENRTLCDQMSEKNREITNSQAELTEREQDKKHLQVQLIAKKRETTNLHSLLTEREREVEVL